MSKYPKLSNYVSELDRFIQSFDQQCSRLSLSQEKEQQKYQQIYLLRDQINTIAISVKNVWEKF